MGFFFFILLNVFNLESNLILSLETFLADFDRYLKTGNVKLILKEIGGYMHFDIWSWEYSEIQKTMEKEEVIIAMYLMLFQRIKSLI